MMTGRERFDAIMTHDKFDRLPVWYFGVWQETFLRWQKEMGFSCMRDIVDAAGMDIEWEKGMWSDHGLVDLWPRLDLPTGVIEEKDDCIIERNKFGAIVKQDKKRNSIPFHIEEALKPTRSDWKRYKKYLDPTDKGRYPADFDNILKEVNTSSDPIVFFAGSLFGLPRDWLGLEAISMLSYDDPVLYEEIIDWLTNFYITLLEPVLKTAKFDVAYIFEDCCGKNGPLFSPDTYRRFYHKYYCKLTEFLHSMGVKHVMLDSDGQMEQLIPLWLDSGVDIIFPIEVGTWCADPVELRRKFGKRLKMVGGVNKHVISQGEAAIRKELEHLKPLVMEGGFIPLPDHRIPPDVSFSQLKDYFNIFKDVFKKPQKIGRNSSCVK